MVNKLFVKNILNNLNLFFYLFCGVFILNMFLLKKKLDKCLYGEVCKYFLSNSFVDCY